MTNHHPQQPVGIHQCTNWSRRDGVSVWKSGPRTGKRLVWTSPDQVSLFISSASPPTQTTTSWHQGHPSLTRNARWRGWLLLQHLTGVGRNERGTRYASKISLPIYLLTNTLVLPRIRRAIASNSCPLPCQMSPPIPQRKHNPSLARNARRRGLLSPAHPPSRVSTWRRASYPPPSLETWDGGASCHLPASLLTFRHNGGLPIPLPRSKREMEGLPAHLPRPSTALEHNAPMCWAPPPPTHKNTPTWAVLHTTPSFWWKFLVIYR